MKDWRGDRKPASERPPYPLGAVVRYADEAGEAVLLVLSDESGCSASEQKCLVLWADKDNLNFWGDDVGTEVPWQFGFTKATDERIA